ncbi:sensor histidine kinase [Chryseolinea sp. H1M3-3]|uniref:sensor histidine kinase n=1 Tax=Chryseolinea sp. H1M3-3 TaxID=3034144 RepID=UPI0023EAE767|nr:sensor histidine kinase [Chryseolinea sp. H1M3-3]
MRLIGIPLFGMVIPNLTGLFGNLRFTDGLYWGGYLYFIALATLIWQGNRYLLFRTRRRFTWFDKPIEKLILLCLNNVFYTSPLTVAWLCVWYQWANFDSIKWDTILIVTLVNVICVLFVTHVYETVFMMKEQQSEQLKNAQLLRAKAEAELSALKNQIDPHFMFNSLNTLTYLITNDSSKASSFTENLAEVYRYILAQKEQSLVLLEDELSFTHKYTDLLHLRFGEALHIRKHFNGSIEKEYLIPPTSVFVAFENAVKHNELSEQSPLEIDMDVRDGNLFIANTIQQRRTLQRSSKIGLKNLEERFKILTGKCISAGVQENKFIISIPLIPIHS